MVPKNMTISFMFKIETAIDAHVRQLNLRLANGKFFRCARISSRPDDILIALKRDVFFILLFFEGNNQGGGDWEMISVAAGQWGANSITYSLTDGPPSLMTFLHDFLGFSVGGVYEGFEGFKEDYERKMSVAKGA